MNEPTDLKRPTPQELALLAASLGLQRDLVSDSDSNVEGALARALRVWKLANQVIDQGVGTRVVSESELRAKAENADQRVPWADSKIARDVFGKDDSDAADPNAIAPVTEDAIRKRLRTAFGVLGGAVFAWGKKHGVRPCAAERFKLWHQSLKEGRATRGDYSVSDFARWLGDEGADEGDFSAKKIATDLAAYVEKAENTSESQDDDAAS